LAALHNFIQVHDSKAMAHLTENDPDHAPGGFYAGDDSFIPAGTGIGIVEDISEASTRRNKIADEMWRQYQEVLHQWSLAGDEESDEESDEGNNEGGDDNDFYL
jgi:hypothetical protein